MSRRLAAAVALIVGAATIVLAVVVAADQFPRGLVLLGCVLLAGAAGWYGALHRGIARKAGFTVAAIALAGAVAARSSVDRRAWTCSCWPGCWSRWRPRVRP